MHDGINLSSLHPDICIGQGSFCGAEERLVLELAVIVAPDFCCHYIPLSLRAFRFLQIAVKLLRLRLSEQ